MDTEATNLNVVMEEEEKSVAPVVPSNAASRTGVSRMWR